MLQYDCYFAFWHMTKKCNIKERLYEKYEESGHFRDKCRNVSMYSNSRKADYLILFLEYLEYLEY